MTTHVFAAIGAALLVSCGAGGAATPDTGVVDVESRGGDCRLDDLVVPDGLSGVRDTIEVIPDRSRSHDNVREDSADVSSDLPDTTPEPGPGDTDGDGVSDMDEIAAGTDWLDPADAPAWHPEWSGHPRLIFGPEDLDPLKARLASDDPYLQLLGNRVAATGSVQVPPHPPEAFDTVLTAVRGRAAKAAAFMALVNDDPALAQKALDILLTINPNVGEIGVAHPSFSVAIIHVAEGLTSFVLAADWLLGTPYLSAEERVALEESVMTLALNFEAAITEGELWIMAAYALNNHSIKGFSALALAGMAFNQRPEAARLVSRGVTQVLYLLLDVQTTPDGGYAEGPAYLDYGAKEFYPMLWALHRASGGEDLSLRNFYDIRTQDDEPTLTSIPDPASMETLHALSRWPLLISMPGGAMPNLDDSSVGPWCGAAFGAALFDDPELRWFSRLPGQIWSPEGSSDVGPELLFLLSPELDPGDAPTWTDQLLDAAGQAVFRDGWGADATWLLTLGEHGKARTEGMGHEHPDANHILLHAGSEYLLMDSGYGGWTEKDKVSHAANHSIVLVDGEGPPDDFQMGSVGSDTFLSGFEITEDWKTVVSSTSYAEADMARRVVLSPEGWLLIHDRATSEESRDWTWLLHGNGGGDSGGTAVLLQRGARWVRTGASINAEVTSASGGVNCTLSEAFHAPDQHVFLTHEALSCSLHGSRAEVLALLRIGPGEGGDAPSSALAEEGSGWATLQFEDGDRTLISGVRSPDAPTSFETPCGPVETDSDLWVIVCEAEALLALWEW